MSNTKNLKPIKTVEEAREKGRRGGIQSGIAKRKKRIMSDLYREFLESEYGDAILPAMSKVVKRGDNSFVSLCREVRETTEGSKVKVNIETDMESLRTNLIETLKKLNGDDKAVSQPEPDGETTT